MRTDVWLFDTPNGGDVTKDLEIRDGLETSVYLSLFGGNTKDDGREKNPFNWWGNMGENNPSRVYRCEAAYLLANVPPAPKNLRRIEDAAVRDLAWVIAEAVSETVRVEATMPKLNSVRLKVYLDGIDPLEFVSRWEDRDDEALSKLVPVPVVVDNDGWDFAGTGLAGAELVFVRANGEIIRVPIDASGRWRISPYPLDLDERATIYVQTRSGLASRGVVVVGVQSLLYDGAVLYDGTQEFNGTRKWL